MHPSFIDRYGRLASPIHRLPATVKLFCTLLLLAIILTVPGLPILVWAGVVAFLVVVAVTSRIPGAYLLQRMLIAEVFIAGIAGLSLLRNNGLEAFVRISVRSTLCVCTLLLLSNTTPFTALLQTLREWKLPSMMVTLLALMYRYLFVLVDELGRMHRARMSRTFSRRHGRLWSLRATLIAQLFVRSLERAERIHAAMSARGWQ